MTCPTAFNLALACLGLVAAAPAPAQPKLSTNEVVFKSGHWSVVRSERAKSGAVGCTGFYDTRRDVQLSGDNLIIQVPDGLHQVVVRYGDELSQPARPPTKVEKQMNAVVVAGADFERLLASRKFAVEADTKDKRVGVVLRLQGLPDALANIRKGCPEPARPVVICSEQLLERMKANGVSVQQMRKICY